MQLEDCYKIANAALDTPKYMRILENYWRSLVPQKLSLDHIIRFGISKMMEFGRYPMPRKSAKQSVETLLNAILDRHDVSGGFPNYIAYQLQKDSTLSLEIIQSLLEIHFPRSIHEDILQAVEIDSPLQISKPQRRDPKRRRREP